MHHALLVSSLAGAAVLIAAPDPAAAIPSPGTYQLVHQGTGQCVDVPGYARGSAVRYQAYGCKRASYQGNQQFTLEAVAGGYRLRGVDSQLCADLPSSSTTDGTYVQQSLCHGGQNQVWNLADEAYGHVRITARLDPSKCVHVDTSSSPRGLRLARCNSLAASARSFAFGATRTHYAIKLGPTGQCLDMPGFTSVVGATPQLYTCKADPATDTTNQEWTFEPSGAGTVRLRQRHAQRCLDLRGGALGNGTIVEQRACGTANSQRWQVLIEAGERFKLRNVASGRCADFYGGNLRQWTCSATYATQLWALAPGLSGAPLGMTSGAVAPTPYSGPSASFAVDPTLASPSITSPIDLHNAITVQWSDPNGARTQGYYVFAWEQCPGVPWSTGDEFHNLDPARRAFWLGAINGRPLVPGCTYTIDVAASSGSGLSAFTPTSRHVVTLPAPVVHLGDGATGAEWFPRAIEGFGFFDANGNGVVDGLPAGPGAFPRFASSSGGSTLAAVGNQYASSGGVRANVIVGYVLDEPGGRTFVAHHMFVDPATNAGTSIAVLYGQLSGQVGTRVWVSLPTSVGSLFVLDGVPALGLPNLVEGTVTAPALASDLTTRVVEFDFSLALEER